MFIPLSLFFIYFSILFQVFGDRYEMGDREENLNHIRLTHFLAEMIRRSTLLYIFPTNEVVSEIELIKLW